MWTIHFAERPTLKILGLPLKIVRNTHAHTHLTIFRVVFLYPFDQS